MGQNIISNLATLSKIVLPVVYLASFTYLSTRVVKIVREPKY